MNRYGVILSGLAAMFVLTVPTQADEGKDKQADAKKLMSEFRSVTGKVNAKTQKLIKANPEYKEEYANIRAKQKELEGLRNALYAKIAEKNPELKELVAKKAELAQKVAALRKGRGKGKANPKGKKKKEEAK